jgi:hypothetical protein
VKKVLYAMSCFVAAFLIYSMVATPGVSQAGALEVEGSVVRNGNVIWVRMDLPQINANNVRIEIHTPQVNGDRQLWQFCNMEYVGLGTYRCGLDVSPGSPTRNMEGKWLGKLKVDGDRVGSVSFRTTNN